MSSKLTTNNNNQDEPSVEHHEILSEPSPPAVEITPTSTAVEVASTPASSTKEPTKAWVAIFQWLPARTPDSDYWWRLTGPHLAAMVQQAGYPLEKQIEALIFHYNWSVS